MHETPLDPTTPSGPFTPKQSLVLKALIQAAEDSTGGDFGFIDEAMVLLENSGMSKYQIGGVISTLIERGDVFAYSPTPCGKGMMKYLQYVLLPCYHNGTAEFV